MIVLIYCQLTPNGRNRPESRLSRLFSYSWIQPAHQLYNSNTCHYFQDKWEHYCLSLLRNAILHYQAFGPWPPRKAFMKLQYFITLSISRVSNEQGTPHSCVVKQPISQLSFLLAFCVRCLKKIWLNGKFQAKALHKKKKKSVNQNNYPQLRAGAFYLISCANFSKSSHLWKIFFCIYWSTKSLAVDFTPAMHA